MLGASSSVRDFFIGCYRVAIEAALADTGLKELLPPAPKGRSIVIGAGKGAAQLAQSFERVYPHEISSGLVVTRYGFGGRCEKIEVIEAAHPVPDANSEVAAQRLLHLVRGLSPDDMVIALITGGGSALLAAPLPPMSLADEIELNKQLLASGAPIGEMNTIRRHVSAIKGGRLGVATLPAKLVTFLVSDVPGDDPAEVASGPTYSGRTTPSEALEIIRARGLRVPGAVIKALQSEAALGPDFRSETHILASAGKSLAAVEQYARALGLDVVNLGDAIEGEAREVARTHAQLVRARRARGWRGLLVSGGETTVTIRGGGKGGRNTEYLLALAIELAGVAGVHCFAADTDGVDGSEDNAGAFADHTTQERLRARGVDAAEYLHANNAFGAFAAIDQLFSPGPSGTNVNDLRLILLE